MTWWPLACVSLIGWAVMDWYGSRPHIPAWRARQWYRAFNLLFLFLLLLLSHKALQWYTELVALVKSCQ